MNPEPKVPDSSEAEAPVRDFRWWEIAFALATTTYKAWTIALVLGMGAVGWFVFYAVSRQTAKDDVLMVHSNLRALMAAADQYMLEHKVNFVARSQLVGPTSYVKVLRIQAGETYPKYFTLGAVTTVEGIGGMRTITYAP